MVKHLSNSYQTGIIGGGSIGVGFALLFAKKKCTVVLYEPDVDRIAAIKPELRKKIDKLIEYQLVNLSADQILSYIHVTNDLSETAINTDIIIECAPEKLEIKKSIFSLLDKIINDKTILASASSALMASQFSAELNHKCNCMITHPVNPPHLIPLIELVPALYTSNALIQRAIDIFEYIGQHVVVLNKEIEGFIFNRLQGAVLREAYCLIRDGVADVNDIDTVMTKALGLRWSVVGPFETVDLNTRGGMASHAIKMGPAYERMGISRGQYDVWSPELVSKVEQQRRQLLPVEHWSERVGWRDEQLMNLLRFKNNQKP